MDLRKYGGEGRTGRNGGRGNCGGNVMYERKRKKEEKNSRMDLGSQAPIPSRETTGS